MQSATVNWGFLAQSECTLGQVIGRVDRRWLSLCDLYHAQDVAKAMGNFAEARRLGAQIVAGLC